MALDTSREKKSETLPSLFPDMMMMTDEDFFMDLSDTLFTSINQPFAFPNPKEICTFTPSHYIAYLLNNNCGYFKLKHGL